MLPLQPSTRPASRRSCHSSLAPQRPAWSSSSPWLSSPLCVTGGWCPPAWARPGFREGCPSILPSLNRVCDQRGQKGLREAQRPPNGLPLPKRPQLAAHPFGQVLPLTSPRSAEVAPRDANTSVQRDSSEQWVGKTARCRKPGDRGTVQIAPLSALAKAPS